MNHQDWEPVVFTKNSNNNSSINKRKKPTKFQELDSDEPPIPKQIDRKISTDISQRRTAKGLTQKKLAQQLNLQQCVINDYESGKVIPDKNILRKIMNALK